MKRCSVIGLINSSEQVKVPKDDLIVTVELPQNQIETKYGLGAFVGRAKKHLVSPSESASELLNLSALVYAADTRISREEYSQDGWTREFAIYFPVNDLSVWKPIKDRLEELLSFITGDFWTLHFREREANDRLNCIEIEEPAEPVEAVSLLSGGLDSFIGAIDLLSENTNCLFVGHYSKDGTQNYQNAVETTLCKEYPYYFKGYIKGCLIFDKSVFKTGNQDISAENSQRSRSFMFLSMAAYLASGMGQLCKLIVPENGFIALNVQLDPLRLGANSTKTVHPHFMSLMSEVFSELNLNIVLVNPYRHMTKGEMMKNCYNQQLLAKHAHETLSCASPGKMRWDKDNFKAHRLGGAGGRGNCGYCYPCLIRKASFKKALIDDNTTYVAIPDFDKAKIRVGKNGTVYAESKDILSVQYAGYRLANGLMKPSIEIHKSGTLQRVFGEWTDISGMYERGLKEVYDLVRDVRVVRSN